MRPTSLAIGTALAFLWGCADTSKPVAPASEPHDTGLTSLSIAPSPGGNDAILFDSRTTLQRATSLAEALALFEQPSGTRYWSFTSNVDGAGTRALRIDWPAGSNARCVRAIAELAATVPVAHSGEVVVEWKQHLGRSSTGGGVGSIGRFAIGSKKCHDGGRTVGQFVRASADAHSTTPDELFWGPHRGWYPQLLLSSGGSLQPNHWEWDPHASAGRAITQTLSIKPESAPGARDGEVRHWVDGRMVWEHTGLSIGAETLRRFIFPGLMHLPAKHQSEYFWDVVIWARDGGPVAEEPDKPVITGIAMSPDSAVLRPGDSRAFVVVARYSDGRQIPVSANYTATGGSIGSDGVYAAGSTAGAFHIVGSIPGTAFADTSTVLIEASAPPPPTVTAIRLSPDSGAVVAGNTLQFTATALYGDGRAEPAIPSYSATGGSIAADGMYTAGTTPGRFRVVASYQDGALADTAVVVVTAPPPPAVTALRVSPDSGRLVAGDTMRFSARAIYSDGHEEGVTPTFSATGGTIDTGGVYRAGTSTGRYRVIASVQNGSFADTAQVVIDPPPVILTAVRLSPESANLAPGDTARFGAKGVYSNGSEASVAVTYAATGGTITPAGLYTAGATAGSFRVIATQLGGSFTDTSAVTITVLAPPPPPPPPSGSTVALVVQRLAAGTGTALVSSAIPLAPGRLLPTQTGQVRVYVNNQEQAVYVEPLAGRHSDGSLRTVLVQFNYSLSGTTPVTGQLVFGQARGVADLARPTANRGSPVAVVLPSDPNYLVTTQVNGPTLTAAASAQLSATFARYESDFVTYADQHWATEGANWLGNYYDRALVYYAFWIRTGRVEYWRRGTLQALGYRQGYLEPGNYNSSPHWSQLEGLEQHYLLTGDEQSRVAVGRTADKLWEGFHAGLDAADDWWDNRNQARVLQAYLLAWRLGASSTHGQNWSALLDDGLTRILRTQSADGAYRFPNHCNVSLNYMSGMLNDVFIKYYTYYRADSRIPGSIQRSIDYMWANEWLPTPRAFKYVSVDCPGTGTPDPSQDLNNLIVTGFAWYAQHSRSTLYRDRADQIFRGGVENPVIEYSKQFTQQYTASFRYLAYRQF